MMETNRGGALFSAARVLVAGVLLTGTGRAVAAPAFPRMEAYKGTLGHNAEAMAKVLDDISGASKQSDRVPTYAGLLA